MHSAHLDYKIDMTVFLFIFSLDQELPGKTDHVFSCVELLSLIFMMCQINVGLNEQILKNLSNPPETVLDKRSVIETSSCGASPKTQVRLLVPRLSGHPQPVSHCGLLCCCVILTKLDAERKKKKKN